MTVEPTEPVFSSPKTIFNPEILLQGVNRASEKVAALHIAFLVLCTYVVVIGFSTTDMDLLIGKSIKLPVVDVEVPITGFYATVPYLVVLVHFNLLLQLQLLSRKLFAFDEVAPKEEAMGGLRDQLHIFPYNYYLVGRPSPLIRPLVALLVNITVLILPLLVILILEARFLAYQSEAITWAQRLAIWLDIGLAATLWPVCMDRQDSWTRYMLGVGQYVRAHWMRWTWRLFGLAILMSLFIMPTREPSIHLFWVFIFWLLLSLLVSPLRYGLRRLGHGRYSAIRDNLVPPVSGMRGLVAITLLAFPLPLLLMVDGERIDLPGMLGVRLLSPLRHLDLHEKVLLAKPVKSETIADLGSGDPAKVDSAMRAIGGIDLQNRSLRQANLSHAVMAKADLRGALLERADLDYAQLQEANLKNAQLQGASLNYAQLQEAFLNGAQLQGVWLIGAQMQGTFLITAQLPGAILDGVQLQGANLNYAQLQGAILRRAQLQGASLEGAQLQGANLERAKLQGADLRKSQFYNKSLSSADIRMVDARGVQWQPLSQETVGNLQTNASKWIMVVPFGDIEDATRPGLEPPEIPSCLRDDETQLRCAEVYSLDKIRETLRPELEKLVCPSRYTARGILKRYDWAGVNNYADSIMTGFLIHQYEKLEQSKSKYECVGLSALTAVNTAVFKELVDIDGERARNLGTSPQPNEASNH